MTRFLKGTDRPLAEAYQLALLDLDGVVYRGKNPVEYAADSIRAAEAAGMTIEYTTNNSSRFQHVVADQLKGFGLDVEPWQVITSSVVAARMVAKALPAGARVQVLGAEHLRDEVTRNGLTIVDGPQDRPQAVIQGWYPDMTWQMMADAAFAVEAGATYFVTNRDLTIPRELGIAPGCGSMIRAVITATGVEPVVTTAIGLTTSFANYFHELIPQLSYRRITAIVCLFSFAVSNVGLSYMITISQPVLMMIYPVLIVLIVLSFGHKWIGRRKMVYIFSMVVAFGIAFINAMEGVGIELGMLTEWAKKLPLYELHLGWMLPAAGGALLGLLPFWKKKEIEN